MIPADINIHEFIDGSCVAYGNSLLYPVPLPKGTICEFSEYRTKAGLLVTIVAIQEPIDPT